MKLWARRGFEWAEDSLVGLWCPVLSGATGSILLDCNLSTSNHGALINYANVTAGWVGSRFGTVLDFDGTNKHVSLSQSVFNRLSVVTVAIWGRPRNTTSRVEIGEGANLTTRTNYGFAEDGNAYVVPNSTAGYCYANWADFGVTNFLHGVFIYNSLGSSNADRGQIFLNGQRRTVTFFGTFPSSSISVSGSCLIGARPGPSNYSDGQAAEVAVWSRALTLGEIQELYQAGPGGAWQLTPPSRRYATILANAYTLIAASASYSITGQPVGLLAGRLLTADAASYLLAGNATGLNAGRLLTANSAACALTGQDANLLAGRLLTGDTATYNLIGNSANLLASRTLQANSAQYTVTGSDAALLAGRLLDCGSSAFLLSPNQAGLLAARKLTADQASILLTTQATNLYAGRKITADTAQFILVASPVDLTFGGGGAAPYYYLFLLGGSR